MNQIPAGTDPALINLAAFSNYQVGPIPLSYQATRYIKTAGIKKMLGIDYCESADT